MLSWNIKLLKACAFTLPPSFWKLILVAVESPGLDDVSARCSPQLWGFFNKTDFTSSPISPVIPTFPLSESSSAHGSLKV